MKLLSCGPTSVSNEVKEALKRKLINTDLDKNYFKFHQEIHKKYSKLLGTNATSFTILAEALAVLEGACLSTLEKGDRALVIYNGYFGKSFDYFVKFAGGEVVYFESDYRLGIDTIKLREFLEKDSDFKIATFVHCETPSAITNDLNEIGNILNEYGILSIADAVSSVGGEYINFDDSKVDILIGGSQKCLSLPSGLGFVTLSKKAKKVIKENKTRAYYLDFANYFTDEVINFPYTVNGSFIDALNVSLDSIMKEDYVEIHKKSAERIRYAFKKAGYEIYAKSHFSNTVTTILLGDISYNELFDRLVEKGYMISGGIGHLEGKSIRIGHMGNNIKEDYFYECFLEIDEIVKSFKVEKGSIAKYYKEYNKKPQNHL